MSRLVLQRLLAPLPSKPEDLYVRATGKVELDGSLRSAFLLSMGARLDFDTYFGAFFESQWQAVSALGGLQFHARVTPGVRIRVYRVIGKGRVLLAEVQGDGDGSAMVPVRSEEAPEEGARLAVEVEADRNGAEIRDLAWVCEAGRAQSRLLVGICSFNERARALLAAKALLDEPALRTSEVRILLVDQSGEAAPAVIPGIEIIRQQNLGGAGGFARIMAEAMAGDRVSHVLMLDDDIDVDPEIVCRIKALCNVAPVPCVIAGQMLDMLAPRTLHEAGGRFDRRRLRAVPNDRGTRVDRDLGRIAARARVDYAAWFCCCLPVDAICRVGLPLPLFINFDDVEFGLRLAGQGIPTISLSGIGVWHMPGYAKDDGWRGYFYYRNIAVIAAIHGVATPTSLTRRLARRTITEIIRARPYRLMLACEGTAAFLAGPDFVTAASDQARETIENGRRRLAHLSGWEAFRQALGLLPLAVRCMLGYLLHGGRAFDAWRNAHKRFTSTAFWRGAFQPPAGSAQSPATRPSSIK